MISIQQIHSLRSPYLSIFGPVRQRQVALVLGPGKHIFLSFNVYRFSCQLCKIFIYIYIYIFSFSCFSMFIIYVFVCIFFVWRFVATETDVIHMCFCRIKFLFCSVLFIILPMSPYYHNIQTLLRKFVALPFRDVLRTKRHNTSETHVIVYSSIRIGWRTTSRSLKCASHDIQLPKSIFSDSVISVFSYTTQFSLFYDLVALFDWYCT